MAVSPSALNDEERGKELSVKLNVLASEQEERLARYRAERLKLPYVSLVLFPIDSDVLELIPRSKAKEAAAVLFYKQGNDIRIGAVNPDNDQTKGLVSEVEERLNHAPQVHVISYKSLESALARYRREIAKEEEPRDEIRIEEAEVSRFQEALASLQELGRHITSLPPTEILNAIVVSAAQMNASDIHIEPKEKSARLRFRVDGVLQDVTEFEREGWQLVLSRVKVLSKLKLNIKDVPQDGSFVSRVGEDTYDMRVSILPGGYGENIVIRLLNREAEAVQLPDLGMKERDYGLVLEELKRPNGMILITGPTGSGKTTTLASFIREINQPELKIITLEDPIEYRLPGVEQTQVDIDAGYTFAKGLRSILRQDPDVILVGEMRDAETAETAVHAALTGHLVFSTLHTNNAAGAVPRLVDIGIQPFVLAPALNMIAAQRLVRVVCAKCAQEYKPTAQVREQIEIAMRGVQPDVFNPAVLRNSKLTLAKAKGCPVCGQTGYRGRKGVFEIFAVDEAIKKLVLAAADAQTISEAALKQGMTTIMQDAYLKALDKITTIEEVQRISEE